jgi:eukaryotic-like serine/threonine-protein kinase
LIAHAPTMSKPLRARQKLGKYRIVRRLGEGGFANVYEAMDTIEGLRVALKIPHDHLVTPSVLGDFRNEVRLTAKLDHPHILPIKDASIIEGRFVIAMPLGERTLHDRLRSRMAIGTALELAEQILEAVAYAHRQRIVHCDIKPENVVLFPDGRLRLTDFGIAKVARNTLRGSGTGTVGFMAPEQAMGKPSLRSDVFSLGLVLYRMLSGHWPEWPFDWPPAGYHRLRGRVHPDMIALLKRAIDPDPRKRFRDADQMHRAFTKAATKVRRQLARRRSAADSRTERRGTTKRG